MGNAAIIIRSVGPHQNGRSYDAEQIAKRCVDELVSHNHNVLSASVETGGCSIDLLRGGSLRGFVEDNGRLVPFKGEDPAWRLADPDYPARCAYERYLHASGGKSLISGADLPGFDALPDPIKAAWRAAADPSAPRMTR